MWTWPTGANGADARRALRVLSIPINWKDGVLESLTWGTEVFSSEIGMEQRRSYRRFPRRSFEVSYLRQKEHRSRLDNFLTGLGRQEFLFPLWHEMFTLDGAGNNTGTVVFPEGSLALREFRLNDLVLVTANDPNHYDVLTVTTLNVETDTMVLKGLGNTFAWPRGSRIVPLREARLMDTIKLSNPTDRVGQITLRPTLSKPDEQFLASWGYCAPLWRWRPDRAEAIDMDFMRSDFVLDFDAGVVEVLDPGNRAQIVQSMQMKFFGREDLADFRAFLYMARGKAVRFYVPSYTDDIQLLKPAFGPTFDAKMNGFNEYQQAPQEARKMIGVAFKDRRPTIYRNIVGTQPLLSTSAPFRQVGERFSVDIDMPPIDPDEVERIMFIVPSRFDADQIDIKHHVAGSFAASVGVTTRSSVVDGMPPIECWVTSLTYPLVASDSMTGSFKLTGGQLRDPTVPFSDSMQGDFDLLSGELRSPLKVGAAETDSMTAAFVLTSGVLRDPLKVGFAETDPITGSFKLTSGTLRLALISHTVTPADSMTSSFNLTGGTLQ